jgi:YhcH/YjgK/YiaL family protein
MKDLEMIKSINENAYNFLKNNEGLNYSDGKYEIGNGVYVNIESYESFWRYERSFESHEKFIDIQYMIQGEEIITVADAKKLKIKVSYDDAKDVTFYENSLDGLDYVIRTGEFLILMPGEAHMPCISVNGKKKIRKAVVKVPLDSYE